MISDRLENTMDERQHCPLCSTEYDLEVPFCPRDMSDLVRGPAPAKDMTPSSPAASGDQPSTSSLALATPARAADRAGAPCGPTPNDVPARTQLDAPVASSRVVLVVDGGLIAVQEGQKVVLGRDQALLFSALFTAHDNVSRIHCSVELTGGQLKVTDLSSSNGTFVNGARLEAEVPTVVPPGSQLRLARDVPVRIVK